MRLKIVHHENVDGFKGLGFGSSLRKFVTANEF